MKRISEQIADWLVKHDVTHAFTVTGGGSMFLNVDIASHKEINTVFMHHEQACSMAAEAYARITNKPALLLTTTGPGAINTLNGVYGAFTDSIPMLVISGQVKSDTCLDFADNLLNLRQLGDQEGPTVRLAKALTKYSILIRRPKDLETALPEAYKQATNGRPGPVWLDIPIDIQNSTEQLNFRTVDVLTPSDMLISSDIQKLITELKRSHRPIILAGTGVRLSGAVDLLRTFVEKYRIPLATAWCHDLIESDHDLFVGRPGTIGTRAGNFCLQAADLVIVIGSRLNIRQTGYNYKDFAKNAKIFQVDIDIAELTKKTVPLYHKIIADAKLFLTKFDLELDKTSLPDFASWITWCKNINNEYDIAKEHQNNNFKLNPYVAVKAVFNSLRSDDVIVCGNASACILPFQIGKLQRYNRMFSNSGSASMGYDLPAAIGAAVATDKRVVCFAGDGSIMMNIQELQTLKTLNKNVIIILINNHGYLSIKQTHENFFGKIIGATPETGVQFPDFAKLADSFDINYTEISLHNLQNIDEVLAQDGPHFVNIVVDPEQGFAPRLKAKLDKDGKFQPLQLDDMFPYIDSDRLESIRHSAGLIQSVNQC